MSPPVPLGNAGSPLGDGRRRVEDERLVTGRGTFVDDLLPPRCLHLEFVRSPFAAGRIVTVDIAAARDNPDVACILAGVDLADLPGLDINGLITGIDPPAPGLLALGRVDAVGQPIAAVIAETRSAACDAAQAVIIEIETDAPGERPEAFTERWRQGDVDAAFATARHVVTATIEHARLAPMALEPRVALAEFDAASGLLTVWLSTQTPHRARAELARILSLAEDAIRVVAPDVGGAFGGKASLYPEDAVVAFAALRLGRPVKWCATRSEDFQAATQGRGGVMHGELAIAEDGRFLALRASGRFPLGYWMPFSAVVPARNAGRILPGPYKIAAVDIRMAGFVTSTAAINIYRGAGRPEATMLMERLVETAASTIGRDPALLRRKNLIARRRLPGRTPTGETLDTADFAGLLARACERGDYPGLKAERARHRRRGGLRGIGLAVYVEPCGTGWESARVGLDDLGRIIAATGSTAQGQGRETAAAQIVASVLGVAPETVQIRHGDTATISTGIGALASRSTAIGGSALLQAAAAFQAKAQAVAARLLQTETIVVKPHARGFDVCGQGRQVVTWRDIAEATKADEAAGGLRCAVDLRYEAQEAWASGAVLAAVTVDRDTCVLSIDKLVWIDDPGVVVNPMLVEGQLVGGLAQGLGEALLERIVYDGHGQLLTGSLMDYGVLRASDMPAVILESRPIPSAMNRLGAKGVGEAGCIGAPAAVVNATLDALAPLGVRHLDMPLTAARLWRAIADATANGAHG
ncbi:xanthine dehydrogenase family protein molybdopterin-binding subunit [Phreatobacter stygius]|uniref:Xanthine dehydrogenase family protein molybdopterin-binding subunit n=2 Tax=Phreatobacter stygius TaxID=1940610 RepID=A0A4D7BNA7_9HYPH|nr:xanthine dehydrogenase family protein molybdopterin-binding subunit [Phreatobacter stygius]